MKILFYNWIPFDDVNRRGGGVTVYLNNLLKHLCQKSEVQCYFLSSGVEYTFDGVLRIEATDNCYADRVRSFQIINSPVHAPAFMQFNDLQTYLEDYSLLDLLKNFWEEQGGFDIIHFHNLEGLSLPVLKLKELYPQTMFLYSLHNYFLFCPQVNLWTENEKNCFQCSQFPHCTSCVAAPDARTEDFIASAKSVLGKFVDFRSLPVFPIMKQFAEFVRNKSIQKKANPTSQNLVLNYHTLSIYEEYRRRNIKYANQYFDKVFAVSRKVAVIAQEYGILENKICVEYIGTAAANHAKQPKMHCGKGTICVGFLGYARSDKGFDFLLRALEMMPAETAAKIDVILAAKCEEEKSFGAYQQRIQPLADRFHSLCFSNGYTKGEQLQLLKRIDLGIVPVLWEDNLPQVAIEYIAYGIPILTSDAGGACELSGNEFFIFPSNDIFTFISKLQTLVNEPRLLNRFWDNSLPLTTMDTHCYRLIQHYMEHPRNEIKNHTT